MALAKILEAVLLVLLAAAGDIRTSRIPNRLILPFTAAGLLTGLAVGGLKGMPDLLLGCALPFVLLLPFFLTHILGAGDIKVFCALGAIGGTSFVLWTLAFSFLCGGVLALMLMAVRRNARLRLRHLAAYLKTCLLTFSLPPYHEETAASGDARFPFGVAIFCGTLSTLLMPL